MNRKPIIGLAGGIGSGKSTVAALLAEAGAAIIDSDALNHAQLRSPDVMETLVSWWGPSVCNGSGAIDRAAVSRIIFEDPAQRHRLEAYIHPRIAAQRASLVEAYQRSGEVRLIVLDTPLLVESKLDEACDAVVFVEAADTVRRERVIRYRGWTEADWIRREKTQKALDKKRAKADHVLVNNSSDIDELRTAVHDLMLNLELDRNSTDV